MIFKIKRLKLSKQTIENLSPGSTSNATSPSAELVCAKLINFLVLILKISARNMFEMCILERNKHGNIQNLFIQCHMQELEPIDLYFGRFPSLHTASREKPES